MFFTFSVHSISSPSSNLNCFIILAGTVVRKEFPLVDAFVKGAKLAQKAGFAFVDLKHCHGYLGHEFLSAYTRPGLYGGSFENRTRFLREIVTGIRQEAPGMEIGVRLSAFDFLPFQPGGDGIGPNGQI